MIVMRRLALTLAACLLATAASAHESWLRPAAGPANVADMRMSYGAGGQALDEADVSAARTPQCVAACD